MRFPKRTLIAIAVAMVISTNAAMARSFGFPATRSFSGSWPATVSQSRGANGTYCLTLTENGSLGWRHSGPASLTGVGSGTRQGTFQLIDHVIVATIESQGGWGQNEGLIFAGSAGNGNIAKGFYTGVYGGEEIDSGVLAFGRRAAAEVVSETSGLPASIH
jgi:hypothetical protein